MQDLQDLVQDLASLARKILARFGYFLQDGFYWDAVAMPWFMHAIGKTASYNFRLLTRTNSNQKR